MTAGRTNHALFATAPREHVRLVHVDCQRPHCPICDGGLFVCTVCGQAEGELEAQCPGAPIQPLIPDRSRFITGNERTVMPTEFELYAWLREHTVATGLSRWMGRHQFLDDAVIEAMGWGDCLGSPSCPGPRVDHCPITGSGQCP